jgi:hypothetical protein
MIHALRLCFFLCIALPIPYATAQSPEGSFSVKSLYLSEPIEGFHQIRFAGDLKSSDGTASLVLDPNTCGVNQFGDTEICTKINPSSRRVGLTKLRTEDPQGKNRSLWLVSNAPISGNIFFVTSSASPVPTRLIYEPLSGNRRVICLQQSDEGVGRALAEKNVAAVQVDEKCKPLDRTVDGTKASASLRPGFLNGTYLLILDGKKPNAGTQVTLKPVTYVQKPEYWQIDVVECRTGDTSIPVISPYNFTPQDVTEFVGEKGIELHWNNGEVLRLEK